MEVQHSSRQGEIGCGIGHEKTAKPIKLPFGMVSGVGYKESFVKWACSAHECHLANTVERLCAAAVDMPSWVEMRPVLKLFRTILLNFFSEIFARILTGR